MAILNILIGSDSFRKIRENNGYYIDKTGFLEEMLASTPPEVSLITRPRRFGKTLTMSMLQEFFDIQKDSKQIFEGLTVVKNARLRDEWMNKYPVVFLSLKNIEGEDFQQALNQFKERIRVFLSSQRFLLKSLRVYESDRNICKRHTHPIL